MKRHSRVHLFSVLLVLALALGLSGCSKGEAGKAGGSGCGQLEQQVKSLKKQVKSLKKQLKARTPRRVKHRVKPKAN